MSIRAMPFRMHSGRGVEYQLKYAQRVEKTNPMLAAEIRDWAAKQDVRERQPVRRRGGRRG